MMKTPGKLLVLLLSGLLACSTSEQTSENSLYKLTSELTSIEGKPQYLSSPFVTAGDRVYLVGNQDGSFPDLGWHVTGEMGGIWDHPIKLMDGFTARIISMKSNDSFCLDKATKFINYPMANSHHFNWDKENIAIERLQFIPDGLEGVMVEFRITNSGKDGIELVFSFTGMTDLRPTWLGERTNMVDAEDEMSFDKKLSAAIAKDKNNPWYTAFGSSIITNDFSQESNECIQTDRKGQGKNGTLSFTLNLMPNEEKVIPIFIAGSYQSEEGLRTTYESLKKEATIRFSQKAERYKKITNSSKLNIPDKSIEQMYEWLKYNTEWLVRNVPEQGRGVSAGLPDYPWWFGGDMVYTLQGVLATGDHDLAKNSIQLLSKISQKTNGNGRIIHEVSTNGAVFNPGNVNETAQYITLLKFYLDWTGDTELIKQLFPEVKKGISWLIDEMDPDKNGYPNGNGMMEIPGLDSEMIDVAIYTQQALGAAAEMAHVLGDSIAASGYQQQADALKIKINKEWWNAQDQSFGDFRGTVGEAMPILEAALVRADTLGKPWAVAELNATKKKMKRYGPGQHVPHIVYHNWVVNTPMETGVADFEKGRAALKTASKYENPFGVYVTGIDRTEEPDSVVLNSRKKTFSYIGAVMTLPTGVQAVASAKYGTPEETLGYLNKLQKSFSYALPGSMYEVSPDFGMVTQAWNIYGVAVPIISYFFGIQPKAYQKTIYVSPHMPASWNEASIENVKVGNNSLDLVVSQKEDLKEYRIQQTEAGWTLMIDVKNSKRVIVNGKEMDNSTISDNILKLYGLQNVVQIY
ncbi:MAG: glycogen debranching protein [Cyclobacteriaceae bacterium]